MRAMTTTRRRLVDLSHPIVAGMTTYPGLPGPELTDHLTRGEAEERYGPGVTFHIGRLCMVANTGTYLDSPFHRWRDGVDVAGLRLDEVADLDGVVVDVTGAERRAIGPEDLAGVDVGGRAVLVRTGWDRHWRTAAYAVDAPFLSAEAVEALTAGRVALVGIDAVNIDDVDDPARPAHSRLLAAGIPIVEHLRGLDQLPPTGFRFSAVPAPVQGMGTFPVRAFAVVDRDDAAQRPSVQT
jgi:kynurenine formamidase